MMEVEEKSVEHPYKILIIVGKQLAKQNRNHKAHIE